MVTPESGDSRIKALSRQPWPKWRQTSSFARAEWLLPSRAFSVIQIKSVLRPLGRIDRQRPRKKRHLAPAQFLAFIGTVFSRQRFGRAQDGTGNQSRCGARPTRSLRAF